MAATLQPTNSKLPCWSCQTSPPPSIKCSATCNQANSSNPHWLRSISNRYAGSITARNGPQQTHWTRRHRSLRTTSTWWAATSGIETLASLTQSLIIAWSTTQTLLSSAPQMWQRHNKISLVAQKVSTNVLPLFKFSRKAMEMKQELSWIRHRARGLSSVRLTICR